MNLGGAKNKYPGYGKNVLNPVCAVCNTPSEVVQHAHQQPKIPPYYRALYFDAEDDVDFCGPDCSLKHYTKKHAT